MNQKSNFAKVDGSVKWRGKQLVIERKDKVPPELDKVEKRMMEMERRILLMKAEEEQERRKAATAKKLKDDQKKKRERIKNHFLMMSWLSRFIERNKFAWERRRAAQEWTRRSRRTSRDGKAKALRSRWKR